MNEKRRIKQWRKKIKKEKSRTNELEEYYLRIINKCEDKDDNLAKGIDILKVEVG